MGDKNFLMDAIIFMIGAAKLRIVIILSETIILKILSAPVLSENPPSRNIPRDFIIGAAKLRIVISEIIIRKILLAPMLSENPLSRNISRRFYYCWARPDEAALMNMRGEGCRYENTGENCNREK